MSRWCKQCKVKLSYRNSKRKRLGKYKDRHLCQPCWNNPTEANQCNAITTKKTKCRIRKIPESKGGYCGYHSKKLDV